MSVFGLYIKKTNCYFIVFDHYPLATPAIPDVKQDTVFGSGRDHRGQQWTGNSVGPFVRILSWGIWHYTQILGCGKRRVDGAVMATSEGDTAESS